MTTLEVKAAPEELAVEKRMTTFHIEEPLLIMIICVKEKNLCHNDTRQINL
jgi:hypothetical protein